ncbi:MAG TPA: type II secretion system protein GspG, partial [Anaeromyxobacteraceae bacterium]
PPRRSAAAGVGAYARSWRDAVRRGASRLAITLLLSAALAGAGWFAAARQDTARRVGGVMLQDRARRWLARQQVGRLVAALEVWRLEHGEYPDRLGALVEANLVEARDLRYPWPEAYHYRRRADGGFVLLPPLP